MLKCFKFWPIKNIFRKLYTSEGFIMACLQIYRELLLLATFSDLIQIQKRYPTFLIQLENYFSYQAKTFLVS